MCPIGRGETPLDDLTARARIRDAALELFGEHGYRGTSIRDVARRAGVSAGLVQHHFGSKASLRDACDAHALATVRENARRKFERDDYDADFVAALYDATYPILKYMARGLAEEWAASERLFDEGVEATARWMMKTWPDRYVEGSEKLRRHAATMVCMSMGSIVLHGHLGRWVGTDPLERGHQHLTGLAMLEIYGLMGEFIASPAGRSIRDAVRQYDEQLSRKGRGSDG